MKVPVLVLVLGAGVTAAALPQAQDPVRKQIDAMGVALKPKGFELAYDVFAGRLKEGESALVAFHFRRGVSYAVVAACDEDCSDLDMRLLDPAGREVAVDAEPDDTPVVEIVPEKSGEYRVQIEMAECAKGPCAYGIGVFAAAQNDFDRAVRTVLNDVVKEWGADYTLTDQMKTGALKQKEHEDSEVDLDAGVKYGIIGICDDDCKDLNLELLDAAGARVGIDDRKDQVAMIVVQPAAVARYTVRATMIACGAEPCRYGIGVVKRK